MRKTFLIPESTRKRRVIKNKHNISQPKSLDTHEEDTMMSMAVKMSHV